jgi:hypothetical protein
MGGNMTKQIDLTGDRFGKLVAVKYHKGTQTEECRIRGRWECICDCGNTILVKTDNLRNGHTKSCGCLVKIHGKHLSRVYSIHHNMKDRCNNENSNMYEYYGARGIKVCDRWNSFVNFYEDMGDPPDGYSLERLDVNGGYSKENCKWIPHKEQARNRRDTVMIEGIPLIEWSEKYDLSVSTVKSRYRLGWTADRIRNTPCKGFSVEVCYIKGCSNIVKARKLCSKHYKKEMNYV